MYTINTQFINSALCEINLCHRLLLSHVLILFWTFFVSSLLFLVTGGFCKSNMGCVLNNFHEIFLKIYLNFIFPVGFFQVMFSSCNVATLYCSLNIFKLFHKISSSLSNRVFKTMLCKAKLVRLCKAKSY